MLDLYYACLVFAWDHLQEYMIVLSLYQMFGII